MPHGSTLPGHFSSAASTASAFFSGSTLLSLSALPSPALTSSSGACSFSPHPLLILSSLSPSALSITKDAPSGRLPFFAYFTLRPNTILAWPAPSETAMPRSMITVSASILLLRHSPFARSRWAYRESEYGVPLTISSIALLIFSSRSSVSTTLPRVEETLGAEQGEDHMISEGKAPPLIDLCSSSPETRHLEASPQAELVFNLSNIPTYPLHGV